MPAAVLQRAEERVPRMERDLSALLADVERRAAALGTREREVAEQQEDLQYRAAKLAERERVLKEKERDYEREQRRDTRRYLLEARKEVERTIKELKAAGAASIDATAADARRLLETRAAGEQEALEKLEAAERVAAIAAARERADAADAATADARGVALAVGDAVALGTLGGKIGKLLDVRGNDAVVAVGAMKLTVPFDTLRRMSARHLKDDRVEVAIIDVPDVEVRTEVDVRGMRVHEVDDAVLQALDAAIRADLQSLRIIHGKGTGALRERVNQMLKREKRVKQFRLGAWNEGGAGVTVAEFT
jgi:DNA mismatch repair protein MutS2